MYFLFKDINVAIYTDTHLFDNLPFFQKINSSQAEALLYFVKERPCHLSWKNVCMIRKTIGELYTHFDEGALYGLLENATEEHIYNMVTCMIADIDRITFLKTLQQKMKELQPLDLPLQFSIRRFDECFDAAQIIDYACPKPHEKDIITGVHELLLNAIEHGNLGLTTEEKIHLYKNGNIFHSLLKRLNKQENLLKTVTIDCLFDKENNVYKVRIKDCGTGFISKNIPMDEKTRLHGRGTTIAKQVSFDEIIYNSDTCSVEASIFFDQYILQNSPIFS